MNWIKKNYFWVVFVMVCIGCVIVTYSDPQVEDSGPKYASGPTAKGLKAGDSSGIPVDANGDGTNELKVVGGKTVGGRTGLECIDFDSDGTCDGWITPAGWAYSDGRLPGPMAIVVVTGDNHGDDWQSLTMDACNDGGIVCTFFSQTMLQTGGASYKPDADEVAAWLANGTDVGQHSMDHKFEGWPDADANPYYRDYAVDGTQSARDAAGYWSWDQDGDGTLDSGEGVDITDGTATVTCDGALCLFDPPYWDATTYSPLYGIFRFDIDCDGTIESDIASIRWIAGVSSTRVLTLDQNVTLGAGCSGAADNIRWEIVPSSKHLFSQVHDNANLLRDMADGTQDGTYNSDYQPNAWANPGQWYGGDDLTEIGLVTARLDAAFQAQRASYSPEDRTTGLTNYGRPFNALKLRNWSANCSTPWADGVQDLIDTAIDDKLLLVINTHNVQQADADCTAVGGSSNMKRTVFDSMAAYIKEKQAAGKLLNLTAEQASRLIRAWTGGGGGLRDWNLITNTKFRQGDSTGMGSVERNFGWVTSTGGGTITWNGDGTLTVANTGGTTTVTQYIRPEPGWYYVGAVAETGTVNSGSAGIRLVDWGDNYQNFVGAIDPLWYVEGVGFAHATGALPTQTSTSNAYVLYAAHFYYPDNAVEPIGLQLQGTSLNGTVTFKYPFFFKTTATQLNAYYTGKTAGRYMQGMAAQNTQISTADPTSVGGWNDYAFANVWLQSEDVDTDTPTRHLFGYGYGLTAGTISWPFYGDITASGELSTYVTGHAYADPDDDGTAEDLACGVGGKLDADCDGTAGDYPDAHTGFVIWSDATATTHDTGALVCAVMDRTCVDTYTPAGDTTGDCTTDYNTGSPAPFYAVCR